jgi:hypothetical protein
VREGLLRIYFSIRQVRRREESRGGLAEIHVRRIDRRDKTSPDTFWLKDKSLTDLDNLPEPDVLAQDIIQNLEAASTASGRSSPGCRKRADDVSHLQCTMSDGVGDV